MDPQRIRQRIRELIARQEVPCDETGQVWAGRGIGGRCVLCEQLIPATTVEYEVDIAGQTLRVHPQCYALWQEECEPLHRS